MATFRLPPTVACSILGIQVSDLLRVVQDCRNRGVHYRPIRVPYENRRTAKVVRLEVYPEGFMLFGVQ